MAGGDAEKANDFDVDALVADLEPHVAEGRLVLFTGAGFSRDARTISGDPVPMSGALTELLWPIAFPDATPEESRLEDLYECAVAVDEEATGRALRSKLSVDQSTLPGFYETWFSVPWRRAYTLNVDDLDVAAGRRWSLPAPVRSVSALSSGLPPRVDGLLSVHLNGRVDDFPAMTFSQLQYGQRTAVPDPWYQHLAADLQEGPVVFVGTSLDEPPLWQQVALHHLSLGEPTPARRHRSYLVTPRLGRARRHVLHRLNVQWVPLDAAGFADRVLRRLERACLEGHRNLRGATPADRS